MEIRTEILTVEQIKSELDFAYNFFQQNGSVNTCVMFGIGCDMPADEMYQEIDIECDQLKRCVDEKIVNNIYRIGDDDLILYDKRLKIEFTFCHEHDTHFKSMNQEFVSLIKERWSLNGYKYYEVK